MSNNLKQRKQEKTKKKEDENKLDILGYITVYVKLEFIDNTIEIIKDTCCFRDPLDKKYFYRYLTELGKLYKKRGYMVVDMEYVSKDEYMAYLMDCTDNVECLA